MYIFALCSSFPRYLWERSVWRHLEIAWLTPVLFISYWFYTLRQSLCYLGCSEFLDSILWIFSALIWCKLFEHWWISSYALSEGGKMFNLPNICSPHCLGTALVCRWEFFNLAIRPSQEVEILGVRNSLTLAVYFPNVWHCECLE